MENTFASNKEAVNNELTLGVARLADNDILRKENITINTQFMNDDVAVATVYCNDKAEQKVMFTKNDCGRFDTAFFKAHVKNGFSDDECYEMVVELITLMIRAIQAQAKVKVFEKKVKITDEVYQQNVEL